jgi:hypothetical protein
MELLVLATLALIAIVAALGASVVGGFWLGLAYGRTYHDGAETRGTRGRTSPAWTRPVAHALATLTRHEVHGHPAARSGDWPVLYRCHPHGVFVLSAWLLFLGAPRRPPRTRLAVRRIIFAVPILRELALAHGCIVADEESILAALGRGESVAVLPGGVHEMAGDTLDPDHVPGIVRLAASLDVPLLHVHFGGEADMCWVWRQPWAPVRWLQLACNALIGYRFPLVWFPRVWRRPRLVTVIDAPRRSTDARALMQAGKTFYAAQ